MGLTGLEPVVKSKFPKEHFSLCGRQKFSQHPEDSPGDGTSSTLGVGNCRQQHQPENPGAVQYREIFCYCYTKEITRLCPRVIVSWPASLLELLDRPVKTYVQDRSAGRIRKKLSNFVRLDYLISKLRNSIFVSFIVVVERYYDHRSPEGNKRQRIPYCYGAGWRQRAY
jgi:hypothetical protein